MIMSSFLAYVYLLEQHKVQLDIHSKSIKNEFDRLQNHALAEARLLSYKNEIIASLAIKSNNNVLNINKILRRHIHSTDVDQIIVTDENGNILTSNPYLETTFPPLENHIMSSFATSRALVGLAGRSIEMDKAGPTIVASMPIFLPQSDYRVAGTITTEFHVDQNFLLNIKRRIGLDVAVMSKNSFFSSTLSGPKSGLSVDEISKLSKHISSHQSGFIGSFFAWLSTGNSKYMTAITELTGEDNTQPIAYLMVLENSRILWQQISVFVVGLFLAFIVIFITVSRLAYNIAFNITAPLKSVSDTLTELSYGKFPELNQDRTSLETMTLTRATENLTQTLKQDKEEIVQAQLELIESETNLSALAENASDGILVVDNEQYLYANEQTIHLLGYNNFSELINTTLFDCVHPNEIEALQLKYIQGIEEESSSQQYETIFIKKDGSRIPVEYSISATTWKGNKAGLIFFRDISERKMIDTELRKHRYHLEELVEQRTEELKKQSTELETTIKIAEKANAAKSDFLSRMSHELRTPMNAILGFGQILESDERYPLNFNQKEMLKEIMNAGYHLLELINEVLDLARIESGHLDLEPEALDIAEIADMCVNQIRDSLAASRNITLHNLIISNEFHVLADPLRLRQVLINFLSNAVKYNKDGGSISIDCMYKPHGMIRAVVLDTGIGIPYEMLSKVFDPFERINSHTHSIEGTGVGLSVCKQLIKAMSGKIGVESQKDNGSTFWFELPVAQQQLEKHIHKAEESLPKPVQNVIKSRILYVEDNIVNQNLVKEILLMSLGTEVLLAKTGEEGLVFAKHELPDLILMDIHLPGISGVDVLKELKKDVATQNIPIIAVSADAMQEQIDERMKEGFSAYITKPFKIDELLGCINQFL